MPSTNMAAALASFSPGRPRSRLGLADWASPGAGPRDSGGSRGGGARAASAARSGVGSAGRAFPAGPGLARARVCLLAHAVLAQPVRSRGGGGRERGATCPAGRGWPVGEAGRGGLRAAARLPSCPPRPALASGAA